MKNNLLENQYLISRLVDEQLKHLPLKAVESIQDALANLRRTQRKIWQFVRQANKFDAKFRQQIGLQQSDNPLPLIAHGMDASKLDTCQGPSELHDTIIECIRRQVKAIMMHLVKIMLPDLAKHGCVGRLQLLPRGAVELRYQNHCNAHIRTCDGFGVGLNWLGRNFGGQVRNQLPPSLRPFIETHAIEVLQITDSDNDDVIYPPRIVAACLGSFVLATKPSLCLYDWSQPSPAHDTGYMNIGRLVPKCIQNHCPQWLSAFLFEASTSANIYSSVGQSSGVAGQSMPTGNNDRIQRLQQRVAAVEQEQSIPEHIRREQVARLECEIRNLENQI